MVSSQRQIWKASKDIGRRGKGKYGRRLEGRGKGKYWQRRKGKRQRRKVKGKRAAAAIFTSICFSWGRGFSIFGLSSGFAIVEEIGIGGAILIVFWEIENDGGILTVFEDFWIV
eukprot:TRINITY_DN591_c0_g1_i1.p2 TRINITY_DN591_c0_g1~~TRINITY_DN591_c0_g1_i1.p2  ORF type:complete len:114 (-),score=9.49 TRINITY_DN591_c0_g1_i1:357-698(-)